MDSIITYLTTYNQYLLNIIFKLLIFISKHIPLKQLTFDDSNSPQYQKFKVDKLPKIIKFEKVDYKLLLAYYNYKYGKSVTPVRRRNNKSISTKIICPKCGAPHEYIYDNNGGKGQFQCKVCGLTFKEHNFATKPLVFKCPYCGSTLAEQKERKHFIIHKCTNKKCSYYLKNLNKLPKDITVIYRLWTLSNSTLDKKSTEIVEKLKDYYNLSPQIVDKLYKEKNVKISSNIYVDKDNEFIWPTVTEEKSNGYCHALKTHLGILVDGTVVPCCLDASGIINLGSIYTDTLENIMTTERYRKLKKSFQDHKPSEALCASCTYKNKNDF